MHVLMHHRIHRVWVKLGIHWCGESNSWESKLDLLQDRSPDRSTLWPTVNLSFFLHRLTLCLQTLVWLRLSLELTLVKIHLCVNWEKKASWLLVEFASELNPHWSVKGLNIKWSFELDSVWNNSISMVLSQKLNYFVWSHLLWAPHHVVRAPL